MEWYEIIITGILSLLGVYVGSHLSKKQLQNQLEYQRINDWIIQVIEAYSDFSTSFNTVITIGKRLLNASEFDVQMYKEFLAKVENSEKRLKLMFSASIESHREFLIKLNEIDNLTKGLDGITFLNKDLADNLQNKLSTIYTDLGVYLTGERDRISIIVKGRSDRMKTFFNPIPNKIKALYLLWFGYHSLIFLVGERYFTYNKMFFPFSKVFVSWKKIGWVTKAEYNTQITFDPKVYDFSELIIYILGPILIYAIIYLWQKKD